MRSIFENSQIWTYFSFSRWLNFIIENISEFEAKKTAKHYLIDRGEEKLGFWKIQRWKNIMTVFSLVLQVYIGYFALENQRYKISWHCLISVTMADAWLSLIYWENQRCKLSWYCPFMISMKVAWESFVALYSAHLIMRVGVVNIGKAGEEGAAHSKVVVPHTEDEWLVCNCVPPVIGCEGNKE